MITYADHLAPKEINHGPKGVEIRNSVITTHICVCMNVTQTEIAKGKVITVTGKTSGADPGALQHKIARDST